MRQMRYSLSASSFKSIFLTIRICVQTDMDKITMCNSVQTIDFTIIIIIKFLKVTAISSQFAGFYSMALLLWLHAFKNFTNVTKKIIKSHSNLGVFGYSFFQMGLANCSIFFKRSSS